MMKSFGQAFSKACAVECRQLSKESPNLCYAQNSVASSRSAEREILSRRFSFGKLAKRFAASLRALSSFSCAYIAKRKAANNFVLFNELLLPQQGLSVVCAVGSYGFISFAPLRLVLRIFS